MIPVNKKKKKICFDEKEMLWLLKSTLKMNLLS